MRDTQHAEIIRACDALVAAAEAELDEAGIVRALQAAGQVVKVLRQHAAETRCRTVISSGWLATGHVGHWT